MMIELLPGLTLMVLFGLIRGRSTGTRLLAVSQLSRKIWVTIWLPAGLRLSVSLLEMVTGPPCSLASASGTTLYRPLASTTVKPCRRSVARNCSQATAGETGFSLVRVRVPLTRGSITRLRPVITPRVRATPSISALVKFRVTGSPGLGEAVFCATAGTAPSRMLVASERQASRTTVRVGCVMSRAQGDDGARAAASPDDVQQIVQCRFVFGGRLGRAFKAQARAHPLALAFEQQAAFQGDAVAAHRLEGGQARRDVVGLDLQLAIKVGAPCNPLQLKALAGQFEATLHLQGVEGRAQAVEQRGRPVRMVVLHLHRGAAPVRAEPDLQGRLGAARQAERQAQPLQ